MFDNDFVYHQEGGKIKSLGYTINNMLLENGLPVFSQRGGGLPGGSDLIIPAGLLLLQQTFEKQKKIDDIKVEKLEDVDVIDEGLYDKLLKLVSVKTKKKQTRRRVKKRKNKTRKR